MMVFKDIFVLYKVVMSYVLVIRSTGLRVELYISLAESGFLSLVSGAGAQRNSLAPSCHWVAGFYPVRLSKLIS